MSIVNLPLNPDILEVTQEQMVMLVIHMATLMPREQLDPNYFDFVYEHIDNDKVKVSFTGRPFSKSGGRAPWSGTKSVEIVRARLNQTNRPISLTVAFKNGLAFEHVIRALKETYALNVSVGELLLKNPVSGVYESFMETSRPTSNLLEFKFCNNQARINPVGSGFSVVLDNSGRPDINDYLHLIKAGSIAGGM